MDRNELNQWIAYHTSNFPNWGDWLRKHGHTTVDVVCRILQDRSLQAAKAATDEMSVGAIAKPFHYEDHARVVAERAATLDNDLEARAIERDFAIEAAQQDDKKVFIDGEQVYKCSQCEDQGYVSVVKLKTMRLAQSGEYDELIEWWQSYDCAVRDEKERLIDNPKFSMKSVMSMCDESLDQHRRKYGPKPAHKQYDGPQLTACSCFIGQKRNAQWKRAANQQDAKTQTVKKPAALPQQPLPTFDPEIHLVWQHNERDWVNLQNAKGFCISKAHNDLSVALEEFNADDF